MMDYSKVVWQRDDFGNLEPNPVEKEEKSNSNGIKLIIEDAISMGYLEDTSSKAANDEYNEKYLLGIDRYGIVKYLTFDDEEDMEDYYESIETSKVLWKR